MPATVHLASYLRAFADDKPRLEIGGVTTVRELLESLRRGHPGVASRILDERGNLRQHVNVFLGGDNIRDLHGLDTAVPDDAELWVLPAVSGGHADPRPATSQA